MPTDLPEVTPGEIEAAIDLLCSRGWSPPNAHGFATDIRDAIIAARRLAPPLAAPAPSAMATGEARAVVITERREIAVKQQGSCACCAAAAWWPGDYAVELNVTSTQHEHHGQIVVWTIKRFCTDVCRECGKLPIAELEDRLAARWQMRSRPPAPPAALAAAASAAPEAKP